jgi:biotin operon repressor
VLDQQAAWCRFAGADLRKVFDAPTTTDRERKQLLRAILTDVIVTVDRDSEQHSAELRAVWEGGQVTEHTVALPRTGSHTRCTDQDTIALVRQLAERYPDKQIAAILARQRRRTGAGNPFTAHRVAGLRANHAIPACPVRATSDDGEMVTIAKAAAELGVSTATVHRWLREGFVVGEQITPGAPWQIRLTAELRQRVREQAPDGWLPLAQAAQALGVARQTVLHKVQRGELPAVYVHNGKRKGLRIQVKPDQAGLFENHIREEKQC